MVYTLKEETNNFWTEGNKSNMKKIFDVFLKGIIKKYRKEKENSYMLVCKGKFYKPDQKEGRRKPYVHNQKSLL